MESELIGLLKVLRRWLWLIVLIVGGTTGLLFLVTRNADAVYEASATIQITTPDREDIAVFDEFTSTSDRDEIVITLNKFVEVAQYPDVITRTMEELSLEEEYDLEVDTELGADFVFIIVTANVPEVASEIANAHAKNAIQYFGELRVRPLDEALIYFGEQRTLAKEELEEAEKALTDFQLENGIVSIRDELNIGSNVLETLEIAQAEFDFNSLVAGSDDSSSVLPEGVDPELLDELIQAQRDKLTQIAILEPQYNALLEDVNTARDKFDTVAEKYVEADLKKSFASKAFFIQIIKAADVPETSENSFIRTMAFGVVGSFGLSILLAFVLDYIFTGRREEPEPES